MITLPQATYIIIDPCYVMTDENYDLLLEEYTGNNGPEATEVMVNGHKMALSGTAWGDGTYDSNTSTSFSVDAGIIGAVPLALCCPEKLKEEFVKENSVIMADTTVGFKWVDGTFYFNDLEIYTSYDEEDEDEDNIW